MWSDWSGGVGIIRISKKICPVVSDWSVCSYGFVKSRRRVFDFLTQRFAMAFDREFRLASLRR
jgi:hypothetical protein